jgi:hypothetical protein
MNLPKSEESKQKKIEIKTRLLLPPSSPESVMGFGLMKKLFGIFKEHLPACCVCVEHVSSFIDL